jgi:hypothetical protein
VISEERKEDCGQHGTHDSRQGKQGCIRVLLKARGGGRPIFTHMKAGPAQHHLSWHCHHHWAWLHRWSAAGGRTCNQGSVAMRTKAMGWEGSAEATAAAHGVALPFPLPQVHASNLSVDVGHMYTAQGGIRTRKLEANASYAPYSQGCGCADNINSGQRPSVEQVYSTNQGACASIQHREQGTLTSPCCSAGQPPQSRRCRHLLSEQR